MKRSCLPNISTSLFFLLLIGFSFICKGVEHEKVKINSDWKFARIESAAISEKDFESVQFNDDHWDAVDLPHTAHMEPLLVNNQWQGICWYRKDITIPKFKKGKRIYLELEAAMNHSKIWFNGVEVLEHQGGYLPLVIDVTPYVAVGENVLAVRLDNTDNKITGPKPLKRLDFNMYGGLYRNAWLYIKEQVHISHPQLANMVAGGGVFITTPLVSKEASTVHVKTHFLNTGKEQKEITLVQSVFFKGELIRELKSEKIQMAPDSQLSTIEKIKLLQPKLWSPDTPNLYTLETKIIENEKVLDAQSNRFGIRVFTFQDNKLYINGTQTFLRGVNRHQEYPFVGYALSDNAQYRDAKKIKEAGFDYIRLSHYPHAPAFMEACDELGIVVVDAILGWQYYSDTEKFREYCYTSATNLVRRDRNHPCVLAWEVSLNETEMPIAFMKKLDQIVHDEYPGDTVYSCGWKDDVYDIYLQARQHRIGHPHPLKDKPYSVSEYGDWEYYSKNAGLNQDNLPNDLRDAYSSRQARGFGEQRLLWQAKNVQEAHNDNLSTPAFSDSYWVMYDYNRGYHETIEHSGLMDIFRLPKFAYYFYQSQRDRAKGVVVEIASFWNKDSPAPLKVFSNCEEVALYLDDQLIARKHPDQNEMATKLQHPPFTFETLTFQKGTLKAIGYIDGVEVGQDSVTTPQKPSKLKVWLDKSGKDPEAKVNDVLFLYIAAVDETGTINPEFSENIDLKSTEAFEILNVAAIRAEAGIATALIRIGNKSGKVTVKAASGALSGQYEFLID